jgi:hypothetical protein
VSRDRRPENGYPRKRSPLPYGHCVSEANSLPDL